MEIPFIFFDSLLNLHKFVTLSPQQPVTAIIGEGKNPMVLCAGFDCNFSSFSTVAKLSCVFYPGLDHAVISTILFEE